MPAPRTLENFESPDERQQIKDQIRKIIRQNFDAVGDKYKMDYWSTMMLQNLMWEHMGEIPLKVINEVMEELLFSTTTMENVYVWIVYLKHSDYLQ